MKRLFFLLPIICLLLNLPVNASGKEIAIIVSAKSPLGAKLSADKIKDIYVGKIKSEGGIKLLPANHKDKVIVEEFLNKFIGMNFTAYQNHWVKKVFAEGGSPPKFIETSADVVKYVSGNEGGVGYLYKDELTGGEKNIRVVTIE
jgi:ABC-type phosphate transport system substrate-binding protein